MDFAGTIAVAIRRGLLAIIIAVGASGLAAAHDNVGAITDLMMTTFDQPDAPLVVGPVVVAGDYAIAGWTQEDRGGRALLKRKDHAWAIHLCAGDALRNETALVHMGLPADVAATLASDLVAAEASASPERVALFATFEGVVEMNADGGHPDTGGGHGGDHSQSSHGSDG